MTSARVSSLAADRPLRPRFPDRYRGDEHIECTAGTTACRAFRHQLCPNDARLFIKRQYSAGKQRLLVKDEMNKLSSAWRAIQETSCSDGVGFVTFLMMLVSSR